VHIDYRLLAGIIRTEKCVWQSGTPYRI